MSDPPDLGRPWFWIMRAALALAFVGAVVLARRLPRFRFAAWLLGALCLANLGRTSLLLAVIHPARRAGLIPYTGWTRAAWHCEQALFMVWPAGIAALAIATFWSPRRAWIVGAAYGALVAVLVTGYPWLRQDRLATAYLLATAAFAVTSVVAMFFWWRTRTPMGPPETVAMLFTVFLVGTILGPYAVGRVDEGWELGPSLFSGLYLTIFALEITWLRRRP